MIELRKTAETATSITLSWDPVVGATGYRFMAEKQAKPSHTWDPARSSVRFAKGSAWYRVEALRVGDTGEWPQASPPPPPPGHAAKLPTAPSVIASPPSRIETVTPNQSGDTILTGTDTIFRFAPGVFGSRLLLQGLQRCVVDLAGAPIRGAHDGIKVQGVTRDLHVRHFDIAGARNQGILGTGDALRVWLTDGHIHDNDNPDRSWSSTWYNMCHAIYLGSSGGPWREWVVGNVRVTNQRTGYAFHAYDNAQDGVVTSCTFNVPADFAAANNGYAGAGCIAAGMSQRIKVALTVAEGCRYQFAVGGAGCVVPCIELVDCAEIERQGTWGAATPGAVVGTPGSDPTIAGDPGYRLPWDTRTTGLGTF